MREGELQGELEGQAITEQDIMFLAAGVTADNSTTKQAPSEMISV
jgi:hypothetical protein